MSVRRRIISLFMLLCVAGMTALVVHAAPVTGSISLRLAGGGTVTLYRVGTGMGEYTPCPEFAGSGADLTKPGDPDTAAHLAKYARAQNIPGQTQPADGSGAVRFGMLEPGLYLIVQHRSSAGFGSFRPFLVRIPMCLGERVYYDIDASPKTAMTPPASHPPQTGQTGWLGTYLAVVGLVLLALGWMLRYLMRHEI